MTEKKLERAQQKINVLERLIEEKTREIYLANEKLRMTNDCIMNSIVDGLFIINPDNTIRTVNNAALHMLDYSKEDLIGNPVHMIIEGEPLNIFDMTNASEKKVVQNIETILLTREKVKIPVLFSASFIHDKYLSDPATVCITRDITEHKKADNELKMYASKLEQSNRELQDFANIASHDLQEPLRKVTTLCDRLSAKYKDALGEQGRDYLGRMRDAAGRMQILIDDLLTFARVTTKARPFVPADLSTIAKEVTSDLEIRIEQANGRVEVSDLPAIDADPLQMRQLLQNLIGNALKFTKKEETPVVKVYGTFTDGKSAEKGDASFKLTVEDNGIGFDEQYAERILDVFQRLHGRSEYEGSGIGLSVCKKIAERHGGSIAVTSRPGKGAKFMVTLPVSHSS